MVHNSSAPPGVIVPRLIYDDVAAAIDWLRGAFGFVERLRTPAEPDGTIHHAQLSFGMGSVILTGNSLEFRGKAKPEALRPGQFSQGLVVRVEDAQAHYERARDFGARIISAPKRCEFGEIQYGAEDLEGKRWTFTQSFADVDPSSWRAKIAKIESPLTLLSRPRICYLQIPAIDAQRSADFYEKVFGWKIRHRDSAHPSFDDATTYVSGAFVTNRQPSANTGILVSIWVDDLPEVLARVTANGGQVVDPPGLDSPGGELIANFRDPAGNVIGLYEERPRK